LNIDIRTTPAFDDTAASALLNQVTTCVDQRWPDTRPTLIQLTTRWPAYALPIDSPLRTTLLRVAHTFGVAGLGIPATAGFGVAYADLHAADERIQLDTIPTTQAVYHATLLSLLTHDLTENLPPGE
ncbi:MAG: M20 family peptidase, partial [Pseudonocardiaceae bacterium]